MKTAIISVTNDLVSDNRVHKTCTVLLKNGYHVILVGRQLKNSPSLPLRDYVLHRMKLIFNKEIFFYAEYSFRLFFYLLFHKADLLVSNDLDTLLPNYLISKFKRISLIYDSHELFTEVPELIHNPFARNFWLKIERNILPKLKYTITVNDSIARIYNERYGIKMTVVRNIPMLRTDHAHLPSRKELGLPDDKKIILIQGAGINIHRGSEEAVEAMQWIENALLLIIGSGDVLPYLKSRVKELNLSEKVLFLPRQPYGKLSCYTSAADLGLSLDKDTNLNYRYSLPNKLFDYIQAHIAVLASDLPEVKQIVLNYGVGEVVHTMHPKELAKQINAILNDEEKLKRYREASIQASTLLCWEEEEKYLENVIKMCTIRNP